MNITIPIPDGLDEGAARRVELDAREAVGVRLYREGQFTRGQLAQYLGIERGLLDEVFARHAVGIMNGVTAQEIAKQSATLRQMRENHP